jgi:hypothetical protein
MKLKIKNGVRLPGLRWQLTNLLIALAAFAATTTAAKFATRTTVTTAATTATVTATATTAGRTLFARTSDVHGQGTAIEFSSVKSLNGFVGFLRGAHRDEPEAAGAACHAVHHQVGLKDSAVSGKRVLEIIFSGFEGKISYKQLCAHLILLSAVPLLAPHCSRLAGFQIITETSSLEDLPCRGSH